MRCQAPGPWGGGKAVGGAKQGGQALVLGLFVLTGGLAALFFLFNTGQLVREKTKLVNATDAVAYSAAVMDARALNVTAYTNRALVANEVAIAQMLTLSSWVQYLVEHGQSADELMGCSTGRPLPLVEAMLVYTPVCVALAYARDAGALDGAAEAAHAVLPTLMATTELAKTALTGSQQLMVASLPVARLQVLQQVADANYTGDGKVQVDVLPLRDDFNNFQGAPVMYRYSRDGLAGDERARMADLVVAAVGRDGFTPKRHWSDTALIPSCLLIPPGFDRVDRDGGTRLVDFDTWEARDQADFHRFHIGYHGFFRIPRCDDSPISLGTGEQLATTSDAGEEGVGAVTSSDAWAYSGIPPTYELSQAALDAEDPRLRFVVRVTRPQTETATSGARSVVASSVRLNAYMARPAAQVYAAVSASEVFFSRPVERGDKSVEAPSLFNPYWQARLAEVGPAERGAALLLQGVTAP